MQKIAAIGVAFGMLLVAVPSSQAGHRAGTKHRKHGHVSQQYLPDVYADIGALGPVAPKLCTYMGGPKSSLWSCR